MKKKCFLLHQNVSEELNLLIAKDKISENSRILFVNDGSKDKTWDLIKELSEKDEHFIGICQSRNRGHQNAVLAGMMEAKDVADITISMIVTDKMI